MPPTALIVGAGIGGLSAGLALRSAGWDVQLFEQAAVPRALGFGVALAANAMAALGDLGLADVVRAKSFAPRRGEVRRLDGTVLTRGELPPAAPGLLVVALRPALHGALLDAVGGASVTSGRIASGFSVGGERVTLKLADGGTVDGDILIGADGVRSVIRGALHPEELPPRHSGLVAVRGVIHGAVHHLGDRDAVLYLGGGVEAMIARAGETGIYWYLSIADTLVRAAMREPAGILQQLSPRFDATFQAVTSATTEMRFDALVDRDPMPFWGRDRVTLLGDAAHPLLPQTGQGAAQAMIDAVALASSLRREENPERALRMYEHARVEATADWVRRGRRAARLMRTANPVVCGIRDALLRLLPVSVLANVYARAKRDSSLPRI